MRTWQQFERILDSCLAENLYQVQDPKDYKFLNSLTGSKHLPDKIVKNETGKLIVISKKWQETSGTADEKVLYEIFKLIDLVLNYKEISRAYILIAGNGWRKGIKSFYLEESWKNFLDKEYRQLVKVVSLDSILPLIVKREL